jgi:hypothetical protein
VLLISNAALAWGVAVPIPILCAMLLIEIKKMTNKVSSLFIKEIWKEN